MAPDELASAPHSAANRGGAVGGAAAVSSEPPGLQRPETSHPPAGLPELRTTPPALQIAGAGGKRPALRDGSPAPDACRRWLLACLLSLSLSPLLLPHPLCLFLGPVPALYLGPSPDGGEVPIVLVSKTDGSVSILCGLSQGECGVEIRCLSNAMG